MKSTAEYKDGAGKGRIPFSIGQRISLWYNSNRKGAKRQRMAPLIAQQINRQTVKGEAVFLLME